MNSGVMFSTRRCAWLRAIYSRRMSLSRCLARSSSRYTFVTQLEQVLDGAEEIGLPYIGTPSSPGARYGGDGRRLPACRGGL